MEGMFSGDVIYIGWISAALWDVQCVRAVAMETTGDPWDLFGSVSEEGDSIAATAVSTAGEIPPKHRYAKRKK